MPPKPADEMRQRRFPPSTFKRFIPGVEHTPFGELCFQIFGTTEDGTLDLPEPEGPSEDQQQKLDEHGQSMVFL